MKTTRKGDVNWSVLSIILAVFLLLAVLGLILKSRGAGDSSINFICDSVGIFC